MASMLSALTKLIGWLYVGEILSILGIAAIPGPVIGIILLYCHITYQKNLPAELGAVSDRLLQFLGMLFVPAGVGVVGHFDRMSAEAIPIFGAVVGGTAVTILATAFAAARFGVTAPTQPLEPEAEVSDATV